MRPTASLDSILAEVRRKVPDALLFLVKATEVDAAIDADLEPSEFQEKLHHVEAVERQLREKLRSREDLRGELVTIIGRWDFKTSGGHETCPLEFVGIPIL